MVDVNETQRYIQSVIGKETLDRASLEMLIQRKATLLLTEQGKIDIRGFSLANLDLRGLDFSHFNFNGCDFRGAQLDRKAFESLLKNYKNNE